MLPQTHYPSAPLPWSRSRAAIGALVASLLAPLAAVAVPLPPGSVSVILPGSLDPGLVQRDQSIPFQIFGAGNVLLFEGSLRDRVTKNGAGHFDFKEWIESSTPGLNGLVASIERTDFAGATIDADWDPSTFGAMVHPFAADRSSFSGSLARFLFMGPLVFSGATTYSCELRTDSTGYTVDGTTRIVLISGESVTLTTSRPLGPGAPEAIITSPAPFACMCAPVTITGTANATSGFLYYRLEYTDSPLNPWNVITVNTLPVIAGTLGVWNPGAAPSGYYFFRLTVATDLGATAQFVTLGYLDQSFSSLSLKSPVPGEVVGGAVCFDGTVDSYCFQQYTVGFRKSGTADPYLPVDPGNPVYFVPVVNDPFAIWNTLGIPDGDYDIRIIGRTQCGNTAQIDLRVTVDNTPPVTQIAAPVRCTFINKLVPIVGTVTDLHLAGWVLEYTGGDASGWVTIKTGNVNINNALIATWNTAGLRPCAYTIRLRATDTAVVNCCGDQSNSSEFMVSDDVGCAADFNRNGSVTIQDLFDYLAVYFAACP